MEADSKDAIIEYLMQENKRLQAQNDDLHEEIRSLKQQIVNLQEAVNEFRRELFGTSSEKRSSSDSKNTVEDPTGDTSVAEVKKDGSTFNEAEAISDPNEKEPSGTIVVEAYVRHVSGSRKKEVMMN